MSDEINKINEADESLQDRVRKGKACDHIGFFTPLGFKPFPLENGNFLFSYITLCMMCGTTFPYLNEVSLQPLQKQKKKGILD